MTTIVTRAGKGSPLTNTEVDTNFTNLNSDKLETSGGTLSGPTVVSVNSASNALRITQTGAGNALVVEDSANPDATPFVVDASGKVINGYTATFVGLPATSAEYTQLGSIGFMQNGRYNAASSGPAYNTMKSRSTTIGSWSIVSSGDEVGAYRFWGDDGSAFIEAARIAAAVDGTPGTNSMPGRLGFSTTPAGSSTPVERMRIGSTGSIGIGTAGTEPFTIRNLRNFSGATSAYGISQGGEIQSAVTANAYVNHTAPTTQATAFTLTNVYHYVAASLSIGAGSSVTSQYGFSAGSGLTAATNNYGFHSNIASGTGRWNFYANGTADNYFAGQVQLGAGTASAPALSTTGDTNTGIFFPAADTIAFSEGGAEVMRIDSSGNVGIGTSSPSTLAKLAVAGADDANLFGLSSTTGVLRAVAYRTSSAGAVVEATNAAQSAYANLFLNGLNLLLGTGGSERMRIDSSGNVGIGTSSPLSLLHLNKGSGAADLRFSVAGTLYGTAYASSSDMTINSVTAIPLKLGTNNTERFQIGSSGQLGIGGANYGTSGQVLTSNGSGSAPSWQAAGGGGTGALKNVQVFTSSGTYTRTAGVTTAVVVAVGGGGGGKGATGKTAGGNGGNGGTTSFGSHVTALGGTGSTGTTGGAGGTGGTGATIAIKGQGGGGGFAFAVGSNIGSLGGSAGGQGGGAGVRNNSAGNAGVRGGGGSGGADTDGTVCAEGSYAGGGGGQGETCIKYTTTVGSTETVTIGAGGTAGTGTRAGGAGGAGYIIVYEYS
jgi:hypothetical protein